MVLSIARNGLARHGVQCALVICSQNVPVLFLHNTRPHTLHSNKDNRAWRHCAGHVFMLLMGIGIVVAQWNYIRYFTDPRSWSTFDHLVSYDAYPWPAFE